MNDYTLKGYLLGLLVACPVGKSLPDCPLGTMREWSRVEQLKYITGLSLDEAVKISSQHRKCMAERVD